LIVRVPLLDDALWAIASRGLDRMSEEAWERLVAGARELARDGRGNMTLLTTDGVVVKTFSLNRRVSSALVVPYARRFERSTLELSRRGIDAPRVSAVYSRDAARRHVVTYPFVAGRDLRAALRDGDAARLMERLGRFVATLHQRSIRFRTFHFGNVLVLDDDRMGLLDVVDVRFADASRPLASEARWRNLLQLLRYPEDELLLRTHATAFMRAYRVVADFSESQARAFERGQPDWLVREPQSSGYIDRRDHGS